MSKDNFIMGMVLGAVIMLAGLTLGFYAGWHKHEADSMRFLNEWIEKEIQKQEQQRKLPPPPAPMPVLPKVI
jgi:hypothetical protein